MDISQALTSWPCHGTNRDMTQKAKGSVRRRKAQAARRETLIKVLVTSEERDRFQAAADQMGVSLSTWMRLTAGAATSGR